MNVVKKLYRSTRDKKLSGLCGGLAESMGVDATLLRILAIVLAVFTSGGFILVYILAALVVPKEPPMWGGFGPGPGPGPGGYGGGYGGGYNAPGGGYYSNPTPPQNGPWGGYPGQGMNPQGQPQQAAHQQPPRNPGNLDAMMEDIEKKAMRREIEELKAKLAKIEKGE